MSCCFDGIHIDKEFPLLFFAEDQYLFHDAILCESAEYDLVLYDFILWIL
jgi:hypothetical protein